MSKNMQAEVTSPVVSAEIEQDRRDRRRRKVAAILAGGLVLGVGAGVTLAAWSDSEFASGTFTAGKFNLEGSTDGTTWAEHASSGAAASLSFTAPVGNLSPSDSVYAPLSVRLAAGTTNGANLKLTSIATTDTVGANSAQLSYAIYKLATTSTACDATGVSGAGAAVSTGTSLASAANIATSATNTLVPLAVGAPTSNAGATVKLCIVVTAGANLAQSGVTTSVLQFAATSV